MNVLAVSAHPDDETLGCGGSLLAHRDSGDVIDWLILTRPDEGRHSREVISEKGRQVDEVAGAYGMRTTTQLEFAAGRLETVAFNDIMNEIVATIQRVQPESSTSSALGTHTPIMALRSEPRCPCSSRSTCDR